MYPNEYNDHHFGIFITQVNIIVRTEKN